jgi:C-terminal processing protease CtpA/Prc
VTLDPLPAAEYAASLDADRRLPRLAGVRYLERRDERSWVESLGGGRILVAYNVTRGETSSLVAEIAALARTEKPRALVLDLRLNGGGDNTTYGPLLAELERQAETAQLLVLTSRITFSAAMQLVVDLEQRTNAVFVGEPTGGSPNQFGDAADVALPAAGVAARVATVSWETAGREDERRTRTPDVDVPLRAEDFFAGRDTVLDAALAAAER